METLHFYWDPISPYAYLAWTQIPLLLKEFPIKLKSEPILFAALLNHYGQKGPAEIPEKRRYTSQDLLRWSKHYQIKLVGPPTHPFNPLLPLRCALCIEDQVKQNTFSGLILEYAWAKGKDLNEAKTLLEISKELELDGEKILQKAQTKEVKDQLKNASSKAIQKGIFGVPTFLIDDQMFWGNDRIDFLRSYLRGEKAVDEIKANDILSRPTSAKR